MKKYIFLGSLTLIITAHSLALANNPQNALNRTDKHFFIQNKGQWHPDVLFLCRLRGLDLWITKYGINYTFFKLEKTPNTETLKPIPRPHGKFDHEEMENTTLLGHSVLLKFLNHNPNPIPQPKQKLPGYYNYFIGNDPSKHATFVGLYKEVTLQNLYPGIDLRYYFDHNNLRFDFIVHPGADPSQIAFALEGPYDAYLKNGNLYFTTRFGEVAMMDLHTYQENRTIESHFLKQDHLWKIHVANYDKTKDLIIDPLIYSTLIGGSDFDASYAIAVDANGNAFITGTTLSIDYNTTSGAFQTSNKGYSDAFVTKLNSNGTDLIYSTYIGGDTVDYSYAIAIDADGNAYITGRTSSTNYPITSGAFQTTFGGGNFDAFITKLNNNGTVLIYSTYIGGSSNDYGEAIAVDANGNAYITGETTSPNYPTTLGAFQTSNRGGFDVIVTKLNSNGTALIYSTYVGGNNEDDGYAIAVDANGNAYITGETTSTNYPTTSGAFQTTKGGSSDAFVTKLNSNGAALIYSTYIGGGSGDYSSDIAVDANGNVFITGTTFSTNYPTTPGSFQTTKGGNSDAFVTKLNSNGTALIYSTYIGGDTLDYSAAIAVDANGNAYITGITLSPNYPTTPGAFQTLNRGSFDAFVTKLNNNGTALIYSTYIGGGTIDYGESIAVDANGNAFITGKTLGGNYPTTPGAFQTTYGGGVFDAFVTKLDLQGSASVDFGQNQGTPFVVYPNPNSGTFVIEVEKPTSFELLDLTGKRLHTYHVKGKTLEIHHNLPAGIYFLRETQSGTTQKLIIQN